MPDTEALLRSVLDRWKAGIDGRKPQAVADVFGDAAAQGYVAATFTFRGGEAKDLRLGIVLARVGDDWRTAYYQASTAG